VKVAEYFKINLNKTSNRIDIYEQKQKRKKIALLSTFWIVLFAILAVGVFTTYLTYKKIENKKAVVQQLQKQIETLEASESYLSQNDVYALMDLAKNRISWAKKLVGLAQSLPRDIAITELNYRSNLLQIHGISKIKKGQKDLDRVMSIIEHIESNDEMNTDFTDIKFKLSNRIKHENQEILSFEISCPVR
jgi:Tfp pilus assembly protein PilN